MTTAKELSTDNVKQFPSIEIPAYKDSAVPAGLFVKLYAIMEEMDGVPKTGKHSQGWTFMQANDIFNGARAAFLKHRVLVIPGVLPSSMMQVEGTPNQKGNAALRSLCVFTYTFIDVDTGQQYMTTWPGESQDFSDKGIQQSGTSSMKYMLMKMFLATPDHDPDYNTGEAPPKKAMTETPQGGKKAETPLSGNGQRRLGGEPEQADMTAVTFTAERVKYIGGGNSAYVKFSDGEHAARLYSRDMLRELGEAYKAFAETLTPGPETQDAVKLPAPVAVTAIEKTGNTGFTYWTVTKLAVQA